MAMLAAIGRGPDLPAAAKRARRAARVIEPPGTLGQGQGDEGGDIPYVLGPMRQGKRYDETLCTKLSYKIIHFIIWHANEHLQVFSPWRTATKRRRQRGVDKDLLLRGRWDGFVLGDVNRRN